MRDDGYFPPVLPGLDAWITRAPELPSVASPEDEEIRERDWFDLEVAAREFAAKYGQAAMLRCVARALD